MAKVLSQHQQCIEVYNLLEWRYQFDEREKSLLTQLTELPECYFLNDLTNQETLKHEKKLLSQLPTLAKDLSLTNLTNIKRLERISDEIVKKIQETDNNNAILKQQKWFPFLYTKSTHNLKAADNDFIYRLRYLGSNHTNIQRLEETAEKIMAQLEAIKRDNATFQQQKWFPFLYTTSTRRLEAAHALLTYRLTKLKDLRDPAAQLIKPMQNTNPAQPIPEKPAIVLINKLKKLAGGFFRQLFNPGNTAAIKELQEVFRIKEAAYKKVSHERHLYTSQQALHSDEKKTEIFANEINNLPTLAFANYFQDTKDNDKQGIVNHQELINAFKKLGLARKIRNTPWPKIEELLEKNTKISDEGNMVTNDIIRQAIRGLSYSVTEKSRATKKKAIASSSIFDKNLSTGSVSSTGPDSSGIHEISLVELQLYAAFVLLTQQHRYQGGYQDNKLQSPRSQFASHGQYKYRLLLEIQRYAKALIVPHTEYLESAKRLAEHYLRFLVNLRERERNSIPMNENEKKHELASHSGNYAYLETILTQLISAEAHVPEIETGISNQNYSDQASYDFIANAINSLENHLSNPTSSLTVYKIAELAREDAKVSKVLVRIGSSWMSDEAPAKPMDSLVSRQKLWDSFTTLGLKKKLRNLSGPFLDNISDNNISSNPQSIVTKEVIKKVFTKEVIKEVVEPLSIEESRQEDKKKPIPYFRELCDRFEKDVQDLELGLYTACTLFCDEQYYNMWERNIIKEPYTPFVWRSQYQYQLLQEIKWYAQKLWDLNFKALEASTESLKDYVKYVNEKIIESITARFKEPHQPGVAHLGKPLRTSASTSLEGAMEFPSVRAVVSSPTIGFPTDLTPLDAAAAGSAARASHLPPFSSEPEREQPNLNLTDLQLQTGKERKQLERTISYLSGEAYKGNPYQDITHLFRVFRQVNYLQSGYIQHEIDTNDLEKIDQSEFEHYKQQNFGAILTWMTNDVDSVLRNLFVIEKMLGAFIQCKVKLQNPLEGYLNRLLQVVENEGQKAEKAQEGCPSLSIEPGPTFLSNIATSSRPRVPLLNIAGAPHTIPLTDTPRADRSTPPPSPPLASRGRIVEPSSPSSNVRTSILPSPSPQLTPRGTG
ncbi:MAG: hypothetical protein WBE18_07255, partial [Gammaproteobacteria bacterium]